MIVDDIAQPHVHMPDGSMEFLFDADRVRDPRAVRNTEYARSRVTIRDGQMWDMLNLSVKPWRTAGA